MDFILYYSTVIAPTGQVPAQAPHEIHADSSHVDLPSFIDNAPTGQTPVQASQPIQTSLLICAAIEKILLFIYYYYT